MSTTRSRFTNLSLGLIAAAIGAASLWQFWPYTMDDSFISFRYAQNLVQFGSLNYNSVPPRAEGYTSLSWTLLLAVPHLLHLDVELAAKALGITALSLAAWRASRLAKAIARGTGEGWAAGLTLVFIASCAPTGLHAVSCMETSLYTLCLTLFLERLHRLFTAPSGEWEWGLVACGLSLGLTRPEGNAAAAIGYLCALAWLPLQRRKLAGLVLVLHVLPLATYFFVRAAYYDAWFPLPFYVKLAGAEGLAGMPFVLLFLEQVALPLLPVVALGCWFARTDLATDRGLWAVLLVILGMVAFFLLPEHLMGTEHRFLFPLLPSLCALAAAAHQAFVRRARWPRPAIVVGAIALAVTPLAVWSKTRAVSVMAARAYAQGLTKAHRQLAALLQRAVPPGSPPQRCKLAMGDAGATPYLSGWQTLDTFGLNEHHIATQHNHAPGYVAAFQPDVWVLLSGSGQQFEPLLPWEAAAFEEATKQGYDFGRRLEFAGSYFLWVGTRRETVACSLP